MAFMTAGVCPSSVTVLGLSGVDPLIDVSVREEAQVIPPITLTSESVARCQGCSIRTGGRPALVGDATHASRLAPDVPLMP